SLIKGLKRIGREIVYCSKETLRLEIMGRNVIHDLMNIFWEAASGAGDPEKPLDGFAENIYSLISRNYRQVFEVSYKTKVLPQLYYRLQLVTDHICGMTDGFACDLHQQLKNG